MRKTVMDTEITLYPRCKRSSRSTVTKSASEEYAFLNFPDSGPVNTLPENP